MKKIAVSSFTEHLNQKKRKEEKGILFISARVSVRFKKCFFKNYYSFKYVKYWRLISTHFRVVCFLYENERI